MKRVRNLLGLLMMTSVLVACQPAGQTEPDASQGEQGQATPSSVSASRQSDSSAMAQETKPVSPEAVAEAEGLDVEQVVVSITDEGYATSHGDHYHFYQGQVGYDALFSRDLLVGDDYELVEEDIVTQVAEGYVVRLADGYGLYLTKSPAQNLRD